MLTITGIIILLAGIALFVLHAHNKNARAKNEDVRAYNKVQTDSYNHKELNTVIELPLNRWIPTILGVLLIFFSIANPFSINDATERTVIQPIKGELWTQFGPGLYWSGFFSTKTVWPNNFTIQVSREVNQSPDADLWVLSDAKDGTFSEGDNAELEHTVKWDLPNTPKMMIDLHITYANFENLMSTTLLSYQKKIASFSTQRMSSEAHYSGGKSQLDEYFQDQLRNGQVILNTTTKTRTLDDGTSETYIEVTPRLNKEGEISRSKSDIQTFGILSTYTSMDNVHYVSEIDIKLKQKIKYAADKANSKQELIAAQQEEQTAIVKGNKLIAETTATQEALEVEAVIQARKAKLVAAEKLEEDKYKAASTIALKKAEAEGDRLKVIAGLSPKEQAQFDKDTRIGIAEAISKRPVPYIINNGGGGETGSLSQTYSMQEMVVLIDKISSSKVGKNK
jgi:hypothetical protein